MGSQWTNTSAISRDLSVAQGRRVPAKIVGSVGTEQKPPAIAIKQETEQEFFANFVGDGTLCTKPDLLLIKEMLNLVKENAKSDDEDIEKVVIISKVNTLGNEFVPITETQPKNNENNNNNHHKKVDSNVQMVNATNHTKKEIMPVKKRTKRNAALISLLEIEQRAKAHRCIEEENIMEFINETTKQIPETVNVNQSVEVKLLGPDNFMTATHITKGTDKASQLLHKPAEPEPRKPKTISLSPVNMFKKKSPVNLSLGSTHMFKKRNDSSSSNKSDCDTLPRQVENVFVPSAHADEYYKKFAERHQLQEKEREDIWKKAERLMKEIDTKRLKEKEEKLAKSLEIDLVDIAREEDNITSDALPPCPINIPGLTAPSVRLSVLLPQHRHELPEECKVCMALAKWKQRSELPK